MERTGGQRAAILRAAIARIAVAALTVGGLSALAFASSTASAATRPTTARVISSATNAKLGSILVAKNTVYTLKASRTPCTATCLKAWPPVLLPHGVKSATAGPGVDASKLGTAAAGHGALQVTYSGKRLYWFVKDTAPGQARGNVKDKWGKWSTVTAMSSSGSNNTNATATTTTPTTSQTAAPDTAPAATSPPKTTPPATAPPAPKPTNPPGTQPPPTTSPGTGGVAF